MISVNKVFFLDTGVFGIQPVALPELSIAAALQHLGVTKSSPMDKAEVGPGGDVIITLAQQKPWTYNRYVFSLRQM